MPCKIEEEGIEKFGQSPGSGDAAVSDLWVC